MELPNYIKMHHKSSSFKNFFWGQPHAVQLFIAELWLKGFHTPHNFVACNSCNKVVSALKQAEGPICILPTPSDPRKQRCYRQKAGKMGTSQAKW